MDAFLPESLQSLISLLMVEGVGDKIAKNLISYCGSPEAVFKEKRSLLQKIPEVGSVTAHAIRKFRDFDRAVKEFEFAVKHNIRMLCIYNDDYPNRLRHCPDSPLLLYYKGVADFNVPRMVAIVGTRNATDYGREHATVLAEGLAEMGVTIVSGLAYGIDITAHRGALMFGTPTIGVLAHGLDRLYPWDHRSTASKMLEQGGLITEQMSMSKPDRENFPKRNRIIAGMCDAVVVVEAAYKGGALITAEIANSYNRDVFAVPGRTGDPFSEGCNQLIKSHRAAMITKPADIRYIMRWDDAGVRKKNVQRQLFVELNEDETMVKNILETQGKTGVDTITMASKLTPSKVAGALLGLEIKGVVKSLPGKLYELAGL